MSVGDAPRSQSTPARPGAGEARDLETRERLLAAATRLFAEEGFEKVTVRDICQRARANIAAINYHFGGKVGLYEQVLRSAIETMAATTTLAREAGAGRPPAEQLRVYIRIFVHRVAAGTSDNAWIHKLMHHEVSNPTPALDLVIEQVIRPRLDYLGKIVAALIGCAADDPRVRLSVMSVQAQCMALMNAKLGERIDPKMRMTAERLDELVDHITRFSLAGIEAARLERS